MTKEEYETLRASIFAQLKSLDDLYIKQNTTIEPGSLVMAAGQKCILKNYKVVGGYIYPILHKIRKNGSIHQNERVNVSKGTIITKCE